MPRPDSTPSDDEPSVAVQADTDADADPILVYDDECGVCTRSARFVERHGRVRTVGFSTLEPALEDRLPAGYRSCAHLVTAESVFSCGEAVERALARTVGVPEWVLSAVHRLPGYRAARERVYRWVADNRATIGRILP